MKPKNRKTKYPISKGNHGMALQTPIDAHSRRDKDTNVYIPTEAQVQEAKDWVDFCKL